MRYSNDEILEDMRRVERLVDGPLSGPKYAKYGMVNRSTVITRFGSWLEAVAAAGLEPAYKYGGMWFDCPICGTAFRSDNGAKSRRTCSPDCAKESKRRKVSKGRAATPNAARGRARYVVDVQACKQCGHDGSVRQLEVHHIDHDPYNNERSNLEVLCSKCHGSRHRQPKPASMKKLSDTDVRRIVAMVTSGVSQSRAAHEHQVNQSTVSSIMSGKTWSHVTGLRSDAIEWAQELGILEGS